MKSESKIQQEIIMFYRNAYCLKHHSPRCIIFSVPNESRSKQETLQKMAIGMMPGVSDLLVVRENEVIFVEVKTPTGTQSASQKSFQATVETLGFRYILTRSLDDFKKQMEL